MALHEQSVGATDEWYTPAHVFEAMGVEFDLDPAAPECGGHRLPFASWCRWWLSAREDGLTAEWRPGAFVWLNPPFGGRNALVPWLERFFAHGDGVCLVPDRTSAPWWQAFAPRADAVLFVAPKIKFLDAALRPGRSPAQGTTLLATGSRGASALTRAASNGLGVLFGKGTPS